MLYKVPLFHTISHACLIWQRSVGQVWERKSITYLQTSIQEMNLLRELISLLLMDDPDQLYTYTHIQMVHHKYRIIGCKLNVFQIHIMTTYSDEVAQILALSSVIVVGIRSLFFARRRTSSTIRRFLCGSFNAVRRLNFGQRWGCTWLLIWPKQVPQRALPSPRAPTSTHG